MPYNWFVRWHIRRYGVHLPRPMSLPTVGTGLLISWCGMRGIVTLAAALALPDGGAPFPHRDLIVFCAFCVVLSTLVIQGATLRPLLKLLGLRDDGSVARELETARAETSRAAIQALESKGSSADVEILRREYQARMRPGSTAPESLADLQQHAALAQRRALVDLRARSVIGDDAFHAAEEEIDLIELTASSRIRPSVEGDAFATRQAPRAAIAARPAASAQKKATCPLAGARDFSSNRPHVERQASHITTTPAVAPSRGENGESNKFSAFGNECGACKLARIERNTRHVASVEKCRAVTGSSRKR